MNKEELVAIIRNAKISHKRWLENARALIEGMPLDKNQVPINSTDCAFGQWYYNEGQGLKSISVFREIEEQHDMLHKIYREIFMLLFGEEQSKPSLLSRLFGTSGKTTQEKKMVANDRFHALEQYSKTIMKKLDDLEGMVSAMSIEQIDSFINKKC
jgi:hypothetical protein